MNITINGKNHKVVYIEYHDNIPFSVTVSRDGLRADYDFEIMYGDRKDIRWKWVGSGGDTNKIRAPKFINGTTGVSYWIDKSAKLTGRVQPFFKKIEKPIRLTSYYGRFYNPFHAGCETNNIEYCNICEQHMPSECDQHQYWDDESGTVRYVHDNSEAE